MEGEGELEDVPRVGQVFSVLGFVGLGLGCWFLESRKSYILVFQALEPLSCPRDSLHL